MIDCELKSGAGLALAAQSVSTDFADDDGCLVVLSFDLQLPRATSTQKRRKRGNQEEPVALSPWERAVARLVVQDRTNVEVATMLGVAVRTVANHMAAVLRKTNCKSRFELANSFSK